LFVFVLLLLIVSLVSASNVKPIQLDEEDEQNILDLEFDTEKAFDSNPISSCPTLPQMNSTNVNQLYPSSVKVIMALGDSITAAFGIYGWSKPEEILNEFRGQSGVIGADSDAISLSTFLSHYSPSLIGGSLGQHLAELPGFPYEPAKDQLNGAQSGAVSGNLVDQIDYLYREMDRMNIDIVNDWKVMTILIGANDACHNCDRRTGERQPVSSAAQEFEQSYSAAIEKIYQTIPRVFVNVLPMFNVSQLYNLVDNVTYCRDVHLAIGECDCAFAENETLRTYLDDLVQAFDDKIEQIVATYRAKNDPEFGIMIQPFARNLLIPNKRYISDLDCFHPTIYGHQMIAIQTWNSLVLPGDQKFTTFNPQMPIICPDASTLIYNN